MRNRKMSAGEDIEARCTRCRTVTNHVVVAMVGEKVVRVQCNICSGVHNYHSAKESGPKEERSRPDRKTGAGTASRASGGGGRRASAAAAAAEEWEAATRSAPPERILPYDMGRSYAVNELVQHPVFGLGAVKALFKPNKMEVLFQNGRKLLRCCL